MMNNQKIKKIILAEDNLADVELTRLAFADLSLPIELVHVNDGQELLNYLDSAELSEIALVLLDLNMPRIGGIEILKMMYDDDEYKKLPMVVLSSSLHQADVVTCYEYGANAYVNKPIDINDFNVVIAAIANFWVEINLLPVFNTTKVS